jgi:hypothetical protein
MAPCSASPVSAWATVPVTAPSCGRARMLGISTGRPIGFIGVLSHEVVNIGSIDGAGWREQESTPITRADRRIKNASICIPGISWIKLRAIYSENTQSNDAAGPSAPRTSDSRAVDYCTLTHVPSVCRLNACSSEILIPEFLIHQLFLT